MIQYPRDFQDKRSFFQEIRDQTDMGEDRTKQQRTRGTGQAKARKVKVRFNRLITEEQKRECYLPPYLPTYLPTKLLSY